MKKELILELFQKFETACYQFNNLECWSARELQEILGYSKWDNFYKAIEKAKISCENAGLSVQDHFADVGKMVDIGSNTKREINDVALTRYACYLQFQSGNISKTCPCGNGGKSSLKKSAGEFEFEKGHNLRNNGCH